MVDKNLTSMLDDPNPEQRKTAIKRLAQTKDPGALPYLAAVFKSDRDPEVRELARKAGVFIKQQSGGGSSSPSSSSYGSTPSYGGSSAYNDDGDEDADSSYGGGYGYGGGSLFVDDDIEEEKPKVKSYPHVEVSEKNRTAAEKLTEQALNALTRDDQVRAVKYITQAFEKNPNLRNDPYTVGLAAQITGLDRYRAIEALEAGEVLVQAKQKQKHDYASGAREKDPSEATAGEALIDLLIYGVINMIIIGVGFIGLYLLLNATFAQMANDPEFQRQLQAEGLTMVDVNTFMQTLATEGLPFVLIMSGVFAAFSIIGLVIQLFAVHVAASSVMGGDGTFTGLIHQVTLFLAVAYAVQILLSVGIFVLQISDPTNSSLQTAGSGITFLVSIGVLLQTGNLIGKNYRFGMGNGCVSLFLGSIILTFVSCACYFLFASSISSAMF